ncbi:MAG: hypothetical protein JW993_19150 [Sedimentisphaerales bacterium]|nr:hypothetical protein [Sedimentisphaerales bacterium]
MTNVNEFNTESADAQGTEVTPVAPDRFDFDAYADYEAALLERNRRFWQARSGVAVYRRFRVPACFSWMCKDMEASLAHQLGALQASTAYAADIANFLEPWYGIGTLASAFGVDYVWPDNQAPVMPHAFGSLDDLLVKAAVPIEETAIGRHTLKMIECFLDATRGRIPISLTDTQSPLNALSFLIETNSFYVSFLDCPEILTRVLDRFVPLQVDFCRKQLELIGDAIAWPGHGFASSRAFSALGMSDDVMTLLSPAQYAQFGVPGLSACGGAFGGPAVHSCGTWVDKAAIVRDIPGVVMVDGAFTAQTDPDPNDPAQFSEVFAGSGVALNARMVGDKETVLECVKALWKPGLKLIVVTYGQTPEEQAEVYHAVHEICQV